VTYLAMAKQTEARRAQYRDVLWRWWAGEGDEPYQTLIRLLDDLGVRQATALRDEALAVHGAAPPRA
jgi:hypothetical protein